MFIISDGELQAEPVTLILQRLHIVQMGKAEVHIK